MSLIVRTESDPLALANSMRRVVHDIDPNQTVTKIRTTDEAIADSISPFRTLPLSVFAGIALVLASIGIFSVMAYSVAQRTREIGIRVAMGSSRGRILRLILGYGMRLTTIGVVIGMTCALILTRYISTFLFRVPSIHDRKLIPRPFRDGGA